MNRFHELAQRVTQCLHADPELRRDVAHELYVHLEDSAREFRGAGCSDEEAQQQAIKALGDADELAEQLWHANRGRMRWRTAAQPHHAAGR